MWRMDVMTFTPYDDNSSIIYDVSDIILCWAYKIETNNRNPFMLKLFKF